MSLELKFFFKLSQIYISKIFNIKFSKIMENYDVNFFVKEKLTRNQSKFFTGFISGLLELLDKYFL